VFSNTDDAYRSQQNRITQPLYISVTLSDLQQFQLAALQCRCASYLHTMQSVL